MELDRLTLQKQFEPLIYPKRYKIAKGGRASGKSHFFAECIVKVASQYRVNIICIREIQKSIKYSSKKLIEDKIREYRLKGFVITQTEIRTPKGGIILFNGMQNHTADSVKSLENFDICWVEEAQNISKYSIELLVPTIRSENSEIWFSYNPTYEDDAIEEFRRTLNDNNSVVVHVNYTQNKLCSQTVLDEANRHKEADSKTFDHVWLGGYRNVVDYPVYHKYDFEKHRHETNHKFNIIHVGVDFNVGGCVGVVCGEMGKTVYVIGLIVAYDTMELAREIASIHSVKTIVYPDSSGKNRSANSSVSNIDILREKGLTIDTPKANPPIRDRVTVMNLKFSDNELLISTKLDRVSHALQAQGYDNKGVPEKFDEHRRGSIDDINDALGYYIHRRFAKKEYEGGTSKLIMC